MVVSECGRQGVVGEEWFPHSGGELADAPSGVAAEVLQRLDQPGAGLLSVQGAGEWQAVDKAHPSGADFGGGEQPVSFAHGGRAQGAYQVIGVDRHLGEVLEEDSSCVCFVESFASWRGMLQGLGQGALVFRRAGEAVVMLMAVHRADEGQSLVRRLGVGVLGAFEAAARVTSQMLRARSWCGEPAPVRHTREPAEFPQHDLAKRIGRCFPALDPGAASAHHGGFAPAGQEAGRVCKQPAVRPET